MANLGQRKTTMMLLLLLSAVWMGTAIAGDLNPSAPPTEGTMKPLDEVEPRIPISSVPFIIADKGSYYLTRNLSSEGTAITVSADDVTIDLCGFTLTGPGSGENYGISMSLRKNIEIRNGTIRDFGLDGIRERFVESYNHRIIGIRSVNNGRHGIYLPGNSDVVKDCAVIGNGASYAGTVYGIYVNMTSKVVDNTVSSNGAAVTVGFICGIRTSTGCTVSGNIVYSNSSMSSVGVSGITAGMGNLVSGNTVHSNNGFGIESSTFCRIFDNVVTDNSKRGISAGSNSTITGNVVGSNTLEGINAGDHVTITGNTVTSNGGSGITCTGGTIADNTVSLNNTSNTLGQGGIVVSLHSQVRNNTLEGNSKNNIYIVQFRNCVEGNVMSGSDYGINFAGTGNVYLNNRATSNGTNYNAAGNIDGGGNISF